MITIKEDYVSFETTQSEIKVTASKEKCLGCFCGTSGVCEMYNEFVEPMDGETCSNYGNN